MTKRQKKLYRRALGAALLLFACLALAPTWWASADQPPPGTDECCELGAHKAAAPKAVAAAKPHFIFSDVAGDILKKKSPAQQRGHKQPAPLAAAPQPGALPAAAPGAGVPTFASNDAGPASPLVEHGDMTYQPDFRWHGGLHGVVLTTAAASGTNPSPSAGGAPQNGNQGRGSNGGDNSGNNGTDGNTPGDGGNTPGNGGNGDPTQPTNPSQPGKPVAEVPEPPAIALLAIGAVGLIIMRRRNH